MLVSCLLASQLLAPRIPNPTIARVLEESLILLGWVANWRSLEIYLYEMVADPAPPPAARAPCPGPGRDTTGLTCRPAAVMRPEAQSEPAMQDGAEQDRLSTAAKVAFLSSPETHGGAAVDVRETRAAWVFLAGDRAWKLKKPVRFDHLDYSTLEARGRICAEEVQLNRRLAPDVYLGTARLTLDADGRLAIDGAGATVDWLVVMRRLEDPRMLDQAILASTVTAAEIEAVAARLGGFYAQAPAVPVDPEAHVARFMREIDIGSAVFADPGFGRTGERAVALAANLRAMLAGEPAIVTGRVAAGRILEGHGDLRPEHVCLEQPPVIIDCLEFSPELRLIDPFDEVSFLAMECAVMGARWIGPILLDRCTAMLQDRPARRTLAFYTAFRATLRARQALAHLLDPLPRTPGKWLPLAERYLEEARVLVPTSP